MSDNKAVLRRFDDAVNTGDLDLIAKTIDEVFQPDVLISTPLPVDTTGAQAIKQVWAMLLHAFPDLRVTVEGIAQTWGVVDVASQMKQLDLIQA
jgi:hypothetical protein